MSRPPAPLTDADLHAFVDDQIDAQRRGEIYARLVSNPQAVKQVCDYQTINRELHELFDPVALEVIPRRLLLTHSPRINYWLRAAAVAGLLIFGVGIGWFARPWLTPAVTPFAAALVQDAMSAHTVYVPEVRHPVEVEAEQEQHLVKWLSKRLNAEIRAPRLSKLGYELLGGRLLPAGHGLAGQFMYQDERGQRLTLFVRSGAAGHNETAFQFSEANGIRMFYWIDRDLGYALIGDLSKAALTQAAYLVYEQLNP